jgi:hypothetical protein
MADPKMAKLGEEVVHHSIWHFTGAPLLDSAAEQWKKRVGATLPSVGAFILSKLTGVGWWWAAAISLLTFGLVWFGWHVLEWKKFFANNPVRPVDNTNDKLNKTPKDIASEVEKELKALRQELSSERYKTKEMDRLLQEAGVQFKAQMERHKELVLLKERAKAIRRRWPDAEFCRRPFYEEWWTPGPKQWDYVPWIYEATEWHKNFAECRLRVFPYFTEPYLRSLDLEGVLDCLDCVIIGYSTPGLRRQTAQLDPSLTPIVTITEWGSPSSGDNVAKCGFRIRNGGMCPAVDIRLVPTPVLIQFPHIDQSAPQPEPIEMLFVSGYYTGVLGKHLSDFIIVGLRRESGIQDMTANNLEQMLRLYMNKWNGQRLSILVPIEYEAKGGPNNGKKYISRHEISVTESGSIQVSYINTEPVSMLP